MAFWVYVIKCSDGSYYTGHTDDLDRHWGEHLGGVTPGYTQRRHPLEMVFSQEFQTRDQAFAAEMQIKGWSRKKKQASIAGRWYDLPGLSRRHTAFKP